MSDDYPEFKTSSNAGQVTMNTKSDTFAAEADADADDDTPAPKAKKPKPKVKKAKAAEKPAKKAKGKSKEKVKGAKRAPRTRDPAKLDEFGFRKSTIKSRAAALYKKGATLAEVKEEVGSVQFNLLTELKANGFDIKTSTVKGAGGRDATKYRVVAKSK